MMASTATKPKAAAKSAPAAPAFGEGLDLAGLLSTPATPIAQAAREVVAANDGPRLIELALIHEDDNQPRKADNPGFSDESIAELGATIKARGVKTPISVREDSERPGQYIINHGARRYRGSLWAGKTTIPAFVDNDYTEADQVIENLQRNDLTAREIADFIGREIAKGKKKGEIAKDIGKSASFVTQHVTLLDLPDPIAEAFNTGRAKDVTVVNELVTAYKKNPDQVAAWLEDEDQELTRGSVKLLREYLEEKGGAGRDPHTIDALSGKTDAEAGEGQGADEGADAGKPAKEPKEADPDKLKKAILQVTHDDRPARIMLTKRPSVEGSAWLKYEDDGHEFEAELSTVTLVALIDGA